MSRDPHFQELLSRHGRGAKIAAALGITRQAVYQWEQIPAEKAAAISDALDLPLHALRPDLWPPPSKAS